MYILVRTNHCYGIVMYHVLVRTNHCYGIVMYHVYTSQD